jgi:hypothetical protein
MIEYEELCAALERYVARTGGAATGARPGAPAPQPSQAPAARTPHMTAPAAPHARPSAPLPGQYEPTKETALPPRTHHDEPHDPDFGRLGGHHDDDATHVGSGPAEEHSIDIGDVLSDDEL